MNILKLLGRLSLWLGIIGLGITVTLHLTFGLPPLEAAIESGAIVKGRGMGPNELLGIWIAFSVIFYVLLGGLVLNRLFATAASNLFSSSIGLAAIGCGITMLIIVPGEHISVKLLIVPGLLMVVGSLA